MLLSRVLRRMFARPANGASTPRQGDIAYPHLPKLVAPNKERLYNFFMPVTWMTSNPGEVTAQARLILDQAAAGHHFADNFITWGRNNSMLEDSAFVNSWRFNIEGPADEAIVWRRYVLACAAYHCVQLEGDFVECGAYTGVGMKTVIDYLGGKSFGKTFWGYDVFEHDDSMLNHAMPEHGAGLYERVRAKFAHYPQVKIIKGRIPEVFDGASPEQISYLHIDLNQAPAEVAALDALFDRVVPGGIVVLDDYEWSGIYRPQKLAEAPWFDARHYRVMPLPTGQGLVIKR